LSDEKEPKKWREKFSVDTPFGSVSSRHSDLFSSVGKVATVNVPVLQLNIISGERQKKANVSLFADYAVVQPDVLS